MSLTEPTPAPVAEATPVAPPPAADAPAPLSGRVAAAAAGLVVLHVVLAWLVRQPAVTTGNDDALYLLLARALRAGTYRDLHVLGHPWHSQYPPGYPLLLALFGGTLGPGITGAVTFGILASAVTLVAVFDVARRHLPPLYALTLLALLAVSPHLLAFAGSVRSETPYILLTVASLWLLVVLPGRRAAVLAGTALAVLAALTRSVGLAIVLALGLVWVWERRWARVGWLALAGGITVGLWMLWMFKAPEQFEARSYGVMLKLGSPTERTPLGLVQGRVMRAVQAFLLDGGLGSALGLPRIPGTSLDNLVGMGGTLALAAVGMVASRQWSRLVSAYLLVYAALLVVWTYKLTRFLIPLTPILLLFMVVGIWAMSRRWKPLPRALFLGGVALFYLAGGVQGFGRNYAETGGCPADDVSTPDACLTDNQRDFFRAVRFLRDSTPPTTIVISTKEAVLGLYTGRPELHGQALHVRYGDPFLEGLRRQGEAIFVLTTLHLWHVPDEMVAQCDQFELVRAYANGTDLVRLKPAGAPGPDACPVIQYHAARFTPPLK
ncbi:MAG: glycosyltransferase family 39 protein [Gemmatimonadetes bacterium]|nr:glycosyltransferase family 39 protein [Gemmatimonadota bacterium]